MSENTRDAIRAIAAAPKSEHWHLINDFIKNRWGLFNRIAWNLCRNFGVSRDSYGDDFTSLIAEDAFKLVTENIADPAGLDEIEVWEAMLTLRCKQVVRNYLDRDTPAAGMSSTMRRVRLLKATRDAMRTELGHDPTDIEVVEAHNANMWATRANPIKQGVIASVDDLQVARSTAEIDHHDYAAPVDNDSALHPAESPKFMRLLVEKTKAHNERLGQVAEIWLSGIYREDGPAGDAKTIAAALDVSESTARTYIRKVKEFAVTVMEQDFGITADDI